MTKTVSVRFGTFIEGEVHARVVKGVYKGSVG